MKISIPFLFLAIGVSIQSFSQSVFKPETDEFYKIVPKDGMVEQVASGHIFTEGPVWDRVNNCLYYSDIPANTIFKLTELGEKTVHHIPSGNSNGLTFDKHGHLVVCDQFNKRVATLKHGKLHNIINKFEGKTFNSPNDVVMRSNGDFYFTDPPYGHNQFNGKTTRQMNYSGVYFHKHHKTILIDSSLVRPNGICLSPDEKKLYVAQSEFDWLWKVYDLDTNGMVKSSKIFHKSDKITGNPDGIKVDVNGYVYATGNHGVVIFTPDGKLLGTIIMLENTSNLAWGGQNLDYLYITADKYVYRIKLNTKGFVHY